MNCPQCGVVVNANQKFCGSCGYKLENMQVVQQPTHQPAPPVQQPTQQPTPPPQQAMYQGPSQPQGQPYQPYQPPKKKRGKGCLVFIILIAIVGSGGFYAIKNGLIPVLSSIDIPIPGANKPVEITNITFTMDPMVSVDDGTAFNSVTGITVLADLNNVKDAVDVEILWLYEDEEILLDMIQYQSGDYIEYAIETTDGGFFDIGMYTVIFYIDGVAIANASFEVL